MASYKLSTNAKADINRIYNYGYLTFGERQADNYFYRLFQSFETIANNPLNYPSVDHIRKG
ncbi:type II toxin-antitoxin system RelE/ParE family toxin [Idiomarina aminovorans]|uniref:type II toxin-antitoxin system RelE/ParE family toxin n=1 Tax=Idiomarina aminovorans TaxID=2914829 RepID=UPI002004212B|nr:type II toxin-antitoxin system RelE/ParE family toxin [Idiomarina sp. ATCH4]